MYVLDDVNLSNWISSHGSPSRGFLKYLEQDLENDSRFQGFRVIQEAKLTPCVIDKIIQEAKSISPSLQCHLIILGGNNLRWHEESVETYMAKCDSLVKKFENIPNAYLVFVSLIPSPKSHHVCEKVFLEVNTKLLSLVSGYQKFASFLNLNDIFLPNGRINYTLFSDDKIHLTSLGTQRLAKAISAHLKKLPCEFPLETLSLLSIYEICL